MSGALPSAANIKGVTPWRSQRSRNDGCWGLAEHIYIYICKHTQGKATKKNIYNIYEWFVFCKFGWTSNKHLRFYPLLLFLAFSRNIYIFNKKNGEGNPPTFPLCQKNSRCFFCFSTPKVLLPLITSSLKLKGASMPTVSSNFWALASQNFKAPTRFEKPQQWW